MDRAIHHAFTAEQKSAYPQGNSNEGSKGNEGSAIHPPASAPRALERVQTRNPCGILERIVQTVVDAIYEKAGTAFRRYHIIESVTAFCKDPEKWAADERNQQELKFRLEKFGDISSLNPELEKIASSYASIPLLHTLCAKLSDAGNNITNRTADAVADNNADADSGKLEYERLFKELKRAFLQNSGLQRMIDHTFEDVFPGFANAVKLDSRNRIKAFGTIYGPQDFEGKLFRIEADLKSFLSLCTNDERNRVQQDLAKIIAEKFIDGPENVAANLLKFKADRKGDFSKRVEGKNNSSPERKLLYSALDAAATAIEERKLKKKNQDVIAPPGDKVVHAPSKIVKRAPAQEARKAPARN